MVKNNFRILLILFTIFFKNDLILSQTLNSNSTFFNTTSVKNHLHQKNVYISQKSNTDSNLTLISKYSYGDCSSFFVQNNICFFNQGSKFVSADFNDLNYIKILDEIKLSSTILNISVHNNTAYLLIKKDTLKIIDISDLHHLNTINSFNTIENAMKIVVSGDTVFIVARNKIQIVDLSDSLNPKEIGLLEFSNTIIDLAIKNNYGYVITSSNLQIIDLTDVSKPVRLGQLNKYGEEIVVKDNYAFLASYYNGVRAIDISNPYNPTLVDSILAHYAIETLSIAIEGNLLFSSNNEGFVYVVDISDPNNLKEVSHIDTDNKDLKKLFISDNYLFALSTYNLEEKRIVLFDISNPNHIKEITSYETKGINIRGITIKNHFALISEGNNGLRIVDISDPTSPIPYGLYKQVGVRFNRLIINGNYAYNVSGMDSIDIFEISNLPKIEKVGVFKNDPPYGINDLSFDAQYAVSSLGFAGLLILNASDPKELVPINQFKFQTHQSFPEALGVTIKGIYIYVANGQDGFRIVDISDPSNPKAIGKLETESRANEVFVEDNIAYVNVSGNGIYVIDVSDPNNPQFISKFNVPKGRIYSYHKEGNYVYTISMLSYEDDGVDVFNLNNLKEPERVGYFYSTNGIGMGISSRNGYIFAAFSYEDIWGPKDNGIYVIKNNLETAIEKKEAITVLNMELEQNYPNPFNPDTKIQFKLNQSDLVKLQILDLKGSIVKNLINGFKSKGTYIVKWDGTNSYGKRVSSGMYFYQLQAGNKILIKKMLLLR